MHNRGDGKRLSELRLRRKRIASRLGSHPLAHVDPDKCYEWMRADCSAYDLARQGREDGLVATITQISSGALLVIPGLLFGSEQSFPKVGEAPWLYAGISTFLGALVLAMLEQYMSAFAYRQQTEIARKYYFLESDRTSNPKFVKWVRWCRNAACIAFGAAVIISSIALMTLERRTDGKPSAAAAAATPAAATPAAATPAAATPAATPTSDVSGLRRQFHDAVGSGINPAAAKKELKANGGEHSLPAASRHP